MIKFILALMMTFQSLSIYTFSFQGITGGMIHLDDYRGKKVLLVNIATQSKYVDQLGELEQLYEKYKDSLVIIAFPSNSFGNEPGSSVGISSFISSNYHNHYLVASPVSVSGENIAPVFKWLCKREENGILSNDIKGDFTKYLISAEGEIYGVFAGSVRPLSDDIQNAIRNSYN